MNRIVLALAATTAVAICTPAAAQTSFTIDTSSANTYVHVNSNSTACIFGSCSMTAGLATLPSSFALNVGQSTTFNFANLSVSGGFGVGTASLEAALAFLTPSGSAGTGGTSNYLRLGGIFRPGALAGSLVWDNAVQQVTATDGSKYTVAFGNLVGAQFGSNVVVPVTVTLDALASPAPEPATWAMMIFGFGAVGTAMRYRRRQTKVAYA